jgi:hypothetical protein
MSGLKLRISSVKTLASIILLVLATYFFNRCEDEKAQSRSYPQVRTNPVSGITSNGATFNAEIYSPGAELMTDHGFVWGTGNDPDLGDNNVRLGPGSPAGAYSAEIASSLSKDVEYTVKAFIQTTEHVVYGLPVKFKSLGSGAPVILNFEPESAEWMDTLIIKGKSFSWIKNENIVRLGENQCSVLKATDTSLSIIVSKDIAEIESVLSVEISGNKFNYTETTFKLIAPVIVDYFPKNASWGDTLILTGENFESTHTHNDITATINGFHANIINRAKESLSLIVPYDLITLENPIILKFNKLIVPVSENLTLKPPVISGFYPKEGTWEDKITIKGKFHPQRERNIITIGGIEAYILSNNTDSIVVLVSGALREHSNPVINISEPFTIASPETFKLLPPLIESITPLSGISGSLVVISGKYFDYLETVKFGSLNAPIEYNTGNLIQCRVPLPMDNGTVSITVTVGKQSTVYKDQFTVVNPVITNISPLTGTFNDEVIISGVNLVNTDNPLGVTFTDNGGYSAHWNAEIISASSTQLIVKVPLNLDSIPKRIELFTSYNIITSYSLNDFILSPPEIFSVTPAVFTTGQSLTITGKNFHPLVSGNEVTWGDYQLTIVSSAPDQIVVSVPGSIPAGLNRLCVKTGGYKRYSSELLQHN